MSLIFSPDREFYKLPVGYQTLLEDARDLIGHEEFDQYDSPATGEAIRDALNGETQISLTGFVNLFERLQTTGRIKTNEDLEAEAVEEEPEEETPAGPTLSEHEQFYQTHTAQQIRERIRTDKPFAEFARAQMAGEVQQADGVGQNAPVTREPHPALKKFANNFNQSSRAELRPKGGFITVGDEKFTVQEFNELVDQATSAGLL
jgi:hypothetical protein